MGSTDNEGKQPKSVLWHPSNFADFMKQQMGMINANQMYSNEFLQFSEVWKFLEQIVEAINQGTIDLKKNPELKLNADALNKIGKIYNGVCYLVKNTNEGSIIKWNFKYEYPEGVDEELIQKLPALKDMNPTKTIDGKDWGITIRTAVPIRFALAGYSYGSIISEGKFYDLSSTGMIPKFSPEDMYSKTYDTHTVSRKYYNNIITILKQYFYKYWNILFVNLVRILEHLEKGSFKKQDHSSDSILGDGQ